jgi:SsrA-binding protein
LLFIEKIQRILILLPVLLFFLNKKELKKIEGRLKEKGYTIIPLRVFFTDKNLVKVEIGLGKGKKLHDKRETIKARDVEKEIKRFLK